MWVSIYFKGNMSLIRSSCSNKKLFSQSWTLSRTGKLTSHFLTEMYSCFSAVPKQSFHIITHKPNAVIIPAILVLANVVLHSVWQNPSVIWGRVFCEAVWGKRKSNSLPNKGALAQTASQMHRVYSMWQPEFIWQEATHINWYFRYFLKCIHKSWSLEWFKHFSLCLC